jgi:hypothetical protein
MNPCSNYSQLIWVRLGEIITQSINNNALDLLQKVELEQLNVIFSIFPTIANKTPITKLLEMLPHSCFSLHNIHVKKMGGSG